MPKPTDFNPDTFGSWNSQITARKDDGVHWIWDGFIPWPGITLLTGASMLGKSTLVGMLLDRRREGGELLGKRVRAGTTVVITEEDDSSWVRRQQGLDFGPNVCFCRPDVSTFGRWRRFFDKLVTLYMKREFDLLVIDSLASFLPAAENHPRSLRKALEELRFHDFCSAGVLLVHHPRRAGGRVGSAARGSTALPALTDILLDMRLPGGDPFTRRRLLYGLGRYPETPQRLLIEMNAEASDYAVLADSAADAAFAPALDAIRELLGRADTPLTGAEILERWSSELARPTANTLWRWLTRGCETGMLVRHCGGTRVDPFRYALADVAAAVGSPEPMPVQCAADVTPGAPAQADDRPEQSTARPAAGSCQHESVPGPEDALEPAPMPLPDPPALAPWLRHLMPKAPEQRGKAG